MKIKMEDGIFSIYVPDNLDSSKQKEPTHNGFEIGSSHNNETVFNEKTTILIVGTITPANSAYFYCSPYNRMYFYLDSALGTGLKENKPKKDDSDKLKKEDVENIKRILRENNIAFLDVFSKVERKKDSPKDTDIVKAELAYNAFKKCDIERDTLHIIANSRLAWAELNVIFEENKINKKVYYLRQSRIKTNSWVETFKEIVKK